MNQTNMEGQYLLAVLQAKSKDFVGAEAIVDAILVAGRTADFSECKETLYKTYKLKLDLNLDNEVVRNETSAVMIQIFGQDKEYGAKVLYDLAQFHKITDDHIRYTDALKQLQEKYPKSEYRKDVLFELATVQEHEKDIRSAIKSYTGYLNAIEKTHPNVAIAATKLAGCYVAINKGEEAKNVLKRYLNISPK